MADADFDVAAWARRRPDDDAEFKLWRDELLPPLPPEPERPEELKVLLAPVADRELAKRWNGWARRIAQDHTMMLVDTLAEYFSSHKARITALEVRLEEAEAELSLLRALKPAREDA